MFFVSSSRQSKAKVELGFTCQSGPTAVHFPFSDGAVPGVRSPMTTVFPKPEVVAASVATQLKTGIWGTSVGLADCEI
jgi:hypothetical protein